MIVVDTDVISYFWLEAGRTEAARRARRRDPNWYAPRLLRSEFRNVLYQHMAHRGLSLADAQQIAETVEADMESATYSVASAEVLRLAGEAEHPTYDCEYVALAQELDVTLVTGDQAVADRFSNTAVLLALCSSLIEQSLKGGLVVVGALNLGGSIDPVHNAVDLTELAAEHGAKHVLMPVSARDQMFRLPDDVATEVSVQYYGDIEDALFKGLSD